MQYRTDPEMPPDHADKADEFSESEALPAIELAQISTRNGDIKPCHTPQFQEVIGPDRADADSDWFEHEPHLTFGQLARRVKVNTATVWRWHMKGIKRNGRRIKLQAYRKGGRIVTSLARFQRFNRDVNGDDCDGDAPPSGSLMPVRPKPRRPNDTMQSEAEKQACEALEILKIRGLAD